MSGRWWATAHCTEEPGDVRTVRSEDPDAIRTTAAYWETRSWVDRVETNVEAAGR
jgi:hypothetical protein